MTTVSRIQRRGFTLIELLVVIAIIAILAAILFPVFARARDAARKSTCTSNLKQLGTAQMMYVQDYDERFAAWEAGNPWGLPGGSGWWMNQIQPYVKSYGVFACPNDTRTFSDTGNNCDSCGWGFSFNPANGKFYQASYGVSEWIFNKNNSFQKLASIGMPSNTYLMSDAFGPLTNDWDDCSWQWPQGFARTWYANAGAWGPANHRDYENNKQYVRHGDGEVIAYVDGHAAYMPNRAWIATMAGGGTCGDWGAPKIERPVFYPNNRPN